MRDLVPPETVYVSESGIRNPEDVRLLQGKWNRRDTDWGDVNAGNR